MAKRKKRSESSESRSKRPNQHVLRQIKVLLGVVVFLFVFAAVFDRAGGIGHFLHTFFRKSLGSATPLLSIVMLWLAAKKVFPTKIHVRFFTIVGTVLFFLSFTGFLHSMV